MDLFVLVVAIGMAAGGVLAQEARPGVLRLALEEHVTVGAALFRQEGGHRAAYHDRLTRTPETVREFEDAHHLKEVAGDSYDLRVHVEIDLFPGTLIANRDVVFGRRQGSESDEAQGRVDSPIRSHLDKKLLAPIRRREFRLNEVDLPPNGRPRCSHKR